MLLSVSVLISLKVAGFTSGITGVGSGVGTGVGSGIGVITGSSFGFIGSTTVIVEIPFFSNVFPVSFLREISRR